MPQPQTIKDTQASLKRIQDLDAKSIARVDDLGRQMNFEKQVHEAERIIGLFRRIPESIIEDLSENQAVNLRSQADGFFQILDQALKFSVTSGQNQHQSIANSINSGYDQYFNQLWQLIAFGVAKNTDTKLLEHNARATIQGIKDESAKASAEVTKLRDEADHAVKAIRDAAAEQGVSQQATYFKTEHETHEKAAEIWYGRTVKVAIGLGCLAAASLFLHKWEFLKPTNTLEAVQLICSKAIIFGSVAYVLVLCARNYLSHRHNAVVNKHRQNALLTYRALTEAANTKGTGDIVLAHAASCIFAPQETGYTKAGAESSAPRGVLELLTKATGEKSTQ